MKKYNSFGPGIDVTKEGYFNCLRNIVYTWHCKLRPTIDDGYWQ